MRTRRGNGRKKGVCPRGWLLALAVIASLVGPAMSQAPVPAPPPPAPVAEAPVATQDQKPVDDDAITLASDLVLVPVSVRKERGGAVVDMLKDEFTLLEDGSPQEIAANEDVQRAYLGESHVEHS